MSKYFSAVMIKSVCRNLKDGMKTGICFLFFVLSAFSVRAQLPTDFRSEQVYLCPQKVEVAMGDSIGVKGTVTCLSTADSKPYSKYVYVELINGKDSLLVRQKVSCKDDGTFFARLATDPLGESGVYCLRAYTRLMLNFSNESLAVQPILLGVNFPKRELMVDGEVNCTVIPHGGILIPGRVQSLTACLTDYLGDALADKTLLLLTAHGDTVASCHTSPSGFASLRFVPQPGATYHVSFVEKDIHKDFPIATVTENLPKVQATLTGNKLRYEVLNTTDKPNNSYRLYSYDRRNGVQIIESSQWQGTLQLPNAPVLATVFLTDTADNIVSESTALSLSRDTKSIPFVDDTLHVGDVVNVSFPTSAVSPDRHVLTRMVRDTERWSPHAESALLYLSDYSSPIDFPSCYFDSDNARRNEELVAWIGTVRFKRFNLKEAIQKDTAIYVYQPEMVLNFEGWAENDSKKPFKGGTLVAYNTENDLIYDTSINNDGQFRIAVDDFADGNEFFLQALNSKGKPVMATFHINDDVFPSLEIARHYSLKQSRYASGTEVSFNDANIRRFILPNVTVKARLRHEKATPSNKFYSTNYTDRKKIDDRNYTTLLDIIKDMPGVYFGNSQKDKNGQVEYFFSLTSSRGRSTLGKGTLPIIVDGTKMPNDMLLNLLEMSASEIEEVELLRPWQAIAYAQGCIDGAILVKTRKTTDLKEIPSKGTYYTPMGLAPTVKEEAKPLRAEHEGAYKLLIDVFDGGTVRSYEHRIQVVP